MKQLSISALFIAVLSISTAQGQWEWHSLGGGNAEKIIVIDNSASGEPCGALVFSKDGGTHWIPCTNKNDFTWGEWQDLDAYYTWCYGGDVCKIGSTWYAVSATMQAFHYYTYNSTSGSWEDYGGLNTAFRPNGYFQFHDAQFFTTNTGSFNLGQVIVSATQIWAPYSDMVAGNYKKGLYLRTDGNPPPKEADPMNDASNSNDSEGKSFPKLYRDLELENSDVIYTWYTDEPTIEFWKIDIGADAETYSITDDFNITGWALKEIIAFYQYEDDNNVIHQYITAEAEYSSTTTWDVWHRDNSDNGILSPDGWSPVPLQEFTAYKAD